MVTTLAPHPAALASSAQQQPEAPADQADAAARAQINRFAVRSMQVSITPSRGRDSNLVPSCRGIALAFGNSARRVVRSPASIRQEPAPGNTVAAFLVPGSAATGPATVAAFPAERAGRSNMPGGRGLSYQWWWIRFLPGTPTRWLGGVRSLSAFAFSAGFGAASLLAVLAAACPAFPLAIAIVLHGTDSTFVPADVRQEPHCWRQSAKSKSAVALTSVFSPSYVPRCSTASSRILAPAIQRLLRAGKH